MRMLFMKSPPAPRTPLLVEIARQHQLENDAVRRSGQSKTDAGLELPGLPGMVDHAVQLVSLVACRVEPAQGPEIIVLLDGRCPGRGEIVGDTRCRREID